MGVCSRMVKTANGGWERKEYTRPTIIQYTVMAWVVQTREIKDYKLTVQK
jgi:hypothetical protein